MTAGCRWEVFKVAIFSDTHNTDSRRAPGSAERMSDLPPLSAEPDHSGVRFSLPFFFLSLSFSLSPLQPADITLDTSGTCHARYLGTDVLRSAQQPLWAWEVKEMNRGVATSAWLPLQALGLRAQLARAPSSVSVVFSWQLVVTSDSVSYTHLTLPTKIGV